MIFIVVRREQQKMAVNMLIGSKNKLSGFTYLGLLMVMAIAGIGMAGVGVVWHQDAQREREKELLFIGEEFRKAIGSYYENSPGGYYKNSPGGIKQYPATLEDLIIDKRFPNIKRHLRKLYADPMTHSKPWGLVLQQGQIIGVYSISKQVPIKKTGFLAHYEIFSEAKEYSEWKFIYIPGSIPLNTANQNIAS